MSNVKPNVAEIGFECQTNEAAAQTERQLFQESYMQNKRQIGSDESAKLEDRDQQLRWSATF
jgi:hypothetical protein